LNLSDNKDTQKKEKDEQSFSVKERALLETGSTSVESALEKLLLI
jgi:hypothetical protein